MQSRSVMLELRFEWGVASRAFPGENASGDLHLVKPLPGGGLLGFQLPSLGARTMSLAPGDLLVFVTDGVTAGFVDDLVHRDPPQRLADRIMDRHFRGIDDALVLVVRYIGTSREQSHS